MKRLQHLLTLIGFWPHFVYCQMMSATAGGESGGGPMLSSAEGVPSAFSQFHEMRMNEILAESPDFEDAKHTAGLPVVERERPPSPPASKFDKWKSLKNRYRITRIQTVCDRDSFEMQLELNRAFHGLLYAKDFAHECRARGTDERNITLRLPTSGCGVRVEKHRLNDDAIELSVKIMLQIEEKLRQSIDILRTVRCKVPLNQMGLSLSMSAKKDKESRQRPTIRNGRMKISKRLPPGNSSKRPSPRPPQDSEFQYQDLVVDQGRSIDHDAPEEELYGGGTEEGKHFPSQMPEMSESPVNQSGRQTHSRGTPRVRIWLELGGPDGSGAVVVGQATTLTVRAIVPGVMGVRIVDCAALDGLGESSQQLLDERGCPIDEQVMPALHSRIKPAEEGWSKAHEEDLVEKTYTATFPAFKFPDRERLHVSCGVQLCKGHCPDVNCRTGEQLLLSSDKHLARIDVFNSLAVTAPQIEVDRLRYGRHHQNISVEEQPPFVRPLVSEGTLCLSVSKLALSFCVLGLIFLLAVVVAVFSLVRSRRRFKRHYCSALSANSSTRLHPAEVCTSMFSSSSDSAQSARFGSKLFIPYYPSTLPYGRVY